MSSTVSKSPGVSTKSNSDWNFEQGKETDTAILRYNRVAMLEAVLSIRDRRQQFVRWFTVAILFLAGIAVITLGFFGGL